MSSVYVGLLACTAQMPSGVTVPPRSAHADCAAAGLAAIEPARTPAASTAARERMRIVGRPSSRHRSGTGALPPAYVAAHSAREEQKGSPRTRGAEKITAHMRSRKDHRAHEEQKR